MKKIPRAHNPNLLVDMESLDDAGVYRISDTNALVQTLDFFFPIVNDPRDFGRVVAANSLSDVWAMGASPVTAMNILAYPPGQIPAAAIENLLIGAGEKLKEAGVVLVGGHTLEQENFIFGMSVTGFVNPKKMITNSKAHSGDMIILTKPLGTAVMSDAHSKDGLSAFEYKTFVENMARLNKYAAEILLKYDVSALTDITGFGLLGHAFTMAKNSHVMLSFTVDAIPLYANIYSLMDMYNTQGVCKTTEYVENHCRIGENVDPKTVKLISEAETSGGLLALVRPDQAEKVLYDLHESGDTTAAIIGTAGKKNLKNDNIFIEVH